MGVDYYACDSCGDTDSEYDIRHCEHGHTLCRRCFPQELWNAYGNQWHKHKGEDIYNKYFIEDDDEYGVCFKEEFCPACQAEKEETAKKIELETEQHKKALWVLCENGKPISRGKRQKAYLSLKMAEAHCPSYLTIVKYVPANNVL